MMTAGRVLLFASLFVLTACGPQEPIRLGFIGGLSGRVADLGEAGRNGAQIAIDEINLAGGIAGHKVELLVRDDEQSPEKAIAVTQELLALHVEAIIGPMTSAMAEAIAPISEKEGVVLVSPTVTARKFFGRVDNLFLIMSSTRVDAGLSASFHYNQSGFRRVAAIYDMKNRAYTESWLEDFTAPFQELSGKVMPVPFLSSPATNYAEIADKALESRPDAILLIAGAADAAKLAQKFRERDQQVAMFAAQWATTERLIEYGGKAVEGMYLHNYADRWSEAPRMQALRAVYRDRYQRDPGFAGVAGYDAASVILDAMSRRREKQSLREVLLANEPFPGAEGAIVFDRFGDSARVPHITVIRGGEFISLQ
jgi:branched-chain amino acid transport system substrate-binding protein